MEKTRKSPAYQKRLLKHRLTLYNTQKDVRLSLSQVKRVLRLCMEYLAISTDEVIFHFVSLKKISSLHMRFFDDPSPTDCISLPIDPPNKASGGYHLLGEVFICPQVAKLYAKAHNLSLFEEVIRYAVHGLLHLIGYDDIQLKDASVMRKKEEEVMKMVSKSLT